MRRTAGGPNYGRALRSGGRSHARSCDPVDATAGPSRGTLARKARIVIPFLDLRQQHETIADDLTVAAKRVITSGHYILGEHNVAFETAFADFCGCKHAVTVNTGTSALHLALLVAGVGPGDEVITVSSTFVATVAAIQYCGATPRLVDIDPVTWTLDPEQLDAAITPKTKAIVPVHLHGRLADMKAIMRVARAHRLLVIED